MQQVTNKRKSHTSNFMSDFTLYNSKYFSKKKKITLQFNFPLECKKEV